MSDTEESLHGSADVTRLLAELGGGDRSAVDRLFSALYDELRSLARRQLGRRSDSTLSTTAMVHEVYLKLVEVGARREVRSTTLELEAARREEEVRAGVTRLLAPERYVGTLALDVSVPGAVIYLDGQRLGAAPLAPHRIAVGEHAVRVTHPEYRDFVRFVRDFEEAGGRESEGEIDESADAVRLMSIHQSKGLEFPVVILPDLHRQSANRRDWWALDRHLGLTLKVHDGEASCSAGPLLRGLVNAQNCARNSRACGCCTWRRLARKTA